MDFKKSILSEIDNKYVEMYNNDTSSPYLYDSEIKSKEKFNRNFNSYHNRIKREQNEYNKSLSTIQATRQERLTKERLIAEQKEKIREQRKFEFSEIRKTILTLIPAIILVSVSLLMLFNPLMIFKYIHFGWIIGIYAVAFIGTIIFAIVHNNSCYGRDEYFVKQRSSIHITSAVVFLTLMILSFVFMPKQTIHLSTSKDFDALANLPQANKCSYVLENDIDFKNTCSKGWGRITYFEGVFDGQGYTIENVSYSGDSNSKYSWEFGFVATNRGTIKNLNISNSTFRVSIDNSMMNVGVIAGECWSTGVISNCNVRNTYLEVTNIYDSKIRYNYRYVGGIVGNNDQGVVENCSYEFDETALNDYSITIITNLGNAYVDGVAGWNGGQVNNCYSNCTIEYKED